MNNILCPVDFSAASINAVEFAVRIAQSHNSSVRLLHVITPDLYTEHLEDAPDEGVNSFHDEPEKRLQSIIEAINTDNKVEISSMEVVEGELIEKLSERIEHERISLVVMGTEGVTDVQEARVGSNTIQMIEETDVPVLCVPENARYTDPRHIIYATEFDTTDREHLQPIINFALGWDARITLVHVNSRLDPDGFQSYVSEMKSYFVYEKLYFEQFVTSEDTHVALEHLLNKEEADMVALVHKKRNFIGSIFHRSLTRKMSYMTNFPMLVFRN